ncbi:hypothetical protein PV325_012000, partial [Microctonus aethiopoides]
ELIGSPQIFLEMKLSPGDRYGYAAQRRYLESPIIRLRRNPNLSNNYSVWSHCYSTELRIQRITSQRRMIASSKFGNDASPACGIVLPRDWAFDGRGSRRYLHDVTTTLPRPETQALANP